MSFKEAIHLEMTNKVDKTKLLENWEYYKNYSYLERGKYMEQIERFLAFFQREQLYITTLDDLSSQPNTVLNEIFDFLNIDREKITIEEKYNSFKYNSTIDPSLRKELQEYFQPYNEKLFNFLGRNYDWN